MEKRIYKPCFLCVIGLLVLITVPACGLSEGEIAATSNAATATAASPTPTITKTPTPIPSQTPTLTPSPTPTLTARNHYSLGVDFQEKDEFELALDEFNLAIELNPTFDDAYFERGRTYAIQGFFDLAIEDWSQCIDLEPDHFDALLFRAFAYDDTEDYENAVADYDRLIQLDPLFAEAFYWRGLGYAYLGETETAISDIERALELGMDPELESIAQAALEEFNRLISGQISFDGYWSGNTDQGEVIFFEIENNGIISYGTGFQIPGCETLTPYWAMGGQPKGYVEGNRFLIDGGFAKISGTFTTGSSAFGTLEIVCEGGLNTTWSINKGVQAIRTPTAGELEKLPQIKVPDDLLSRKDGSENFDEYTRVVASDTDWFLVKYMTEWVIPIPSGWTSITVLDGAFYFLEKEDVEEAKAEIRIGLDCGDYETSEDYLANLEEALAEESSIEILHKKILDKNKGYLLISMETEAQEKKTKLLIGSKPPDGCFTYLIATSNQEDWDNFYTILRASVANWYDLTDYFLGIDLPERILE